ncbi:MAG: hypothetical protein HND47_07260 [Chloroflexi bacterium]|nr:hypothetical protein [Chloroflexota bacterium]
MQIGLGVGALLILAALFFFIFRQVNNLRNASRESWKPVLRPVGEMVAFQQGYTGPALQNPGGAIPAITMRGANDQAKPDGGDVVVQLRSKSQSGTAMEDEQRARVLSRLTEENPATVAEIIQLWLNEGKKS